MTKFSLKNKIITLEFVSFSIVIIIIWLDEILDIPHLLWNAKATPINWSESFFESILLLILELIIFYITKKLFKNVRYLEGILPICASCKKIRDSKGYWKQVEQYFFEHSDVDFSHSLCDECEQKLYGKEEWYKKTKENNQDQEKSGF